MDAAELERFLVSVSSGDPDNVAAFCQLVEPDLRRKIRAYLGHAALRRAADSGDIYQSVLLKFLVRMSQRKFEIENITKLKALLWTMALNHMRDLVRRGEFVASESPVDLVAPGSSPSEQVMQDELVAQFRGKLSPEAREIHRWRSEELTWPEIGQRLRKPSHTIRVRYAREVQRITQEMGLEVFS